MACLKTLCSVSTGTDPVTDLTTLGSVAKVIESREKARENGWASYEIPNRTVKLQTGRNGHPDKP